MGHRMCQVVLLFALMLGAGFMAVTAVAQDAGTPVATPVPPVVRVVLASSESAEAPGEALELSRYTIAPGAVLPVHTHPGVQMATVESGTLTYHVLENGIVTATLADGTTATFGPGETAVFTTGDSWVEPEGMVHYAENLTDEPIVLLSASLFTEGVPTAILVDATPVP